MRRVTRNLLLALLAVLLALLALGALPSYLGSGDPYYLTATPADATAAAAVGNQAVDAANLSQRAYPYTHAALADATANGSGRSGPYRRGPVGFKEAFAHSPFDELDALRGQHPQATVGDGVVVARSGTLYRLAVTR